MCTSKMKFLCVNLWLREVCTDDANDDANNDANDDAWWTKHDNKALWLINQMSQKLKKIVCSVLKLRAHVKLLRTQAQVKYQYFLKRLLNQFFSESARKMCMYGIRKDCIYGCDVTKQIVSKTFLNPSPAMRRLCESL